MCNEIKVSWLHRAHVLLTGFMPLRVALCLFSTLCMDHFSLPLPGTTAATAVTLTVMVMMSAVRHGWGMNCSFA